MTGVHDRRAGAHIDGHAEHLSHLLLGRALFKSRLGMKGYTVVASHGNAYPQRDQFLRLPV